MLRVTKVAGGGGESNPKRVQFIAAGYHSIAKTVAHPRFRLIFCWVMRPGANAPDFFSLFNKFFSQGV
jgi:hypothetical protein